MSPSHSLFIISKIISFCLITSLKGYPFMTSQSWENLQGLKKFLMNMWTSERVPNLCSFIQQFSHISKKTNVKKLKVFSLILWTLFFLKCYLMQIRIKRYQTVETFQQCFFHFFRLIWTSDRDMRVVLLFEWMHVQRSLRYPKNKFPKNW